MHPTRVLAGRIYGHTSIEMRQWVLSAAPNVAPFSSTFYQIKSINTLILFGERGGTRTRDLLIKSQLLYRLSYALAS